MEVFELQGHRYIELNDLLKITGLCASGGIANNSISAGLVRVDGQVELRKRCKIRSGQVVEFEENRVDIR